jgi:hypothetical protein
MTHEETRFLMICLALIVIFAWLLWFQIRRLRIEKPSETIVITRKTIHA